MPADSFGGTQGAQGIADREDGHTHIGKHREPHIGKAQGGQHQHGDLYRLNTPYDADRQAALMYVSAQKDEAVFFWYKLETMKNQHFPIVRMAGLKPDAMYTVTELNRIDNSPLPFEGKTFSGAYLMNHGLMLPADHDVDWNRRNEWASRVLRLQVK